MAAHINFMNNIKRFIIVFEKVLHKFTQNSYDSISESRTNIQKISTISLHLADTEDERTGLLPSSEWELQRIAERSEERERETKKDPGKAQN